MTVLVLDGGDLFPGARLIMSIVDGQRRVSLRQRMPAYCLQHKIAVPSAWSTPSR
ncbi:hypothetical protein AAW51_1879 [Caldimonas brevitalea]|uniref:Uncharacterized protein n=1 Tax=Caldimonas brevitalea TaxID=413882 RepID=A0A0G3BPS5_9BURK|nr:hypothetical protein AAW51_1879 [Caldimonas brevitalea]